MTEYKFKHFTNIQSKSDAVFNAVCVKKCPEAATTPECVLNSDVSTECPMAPINT